MTLIELMVILAVMAVVATVAVTSTSSLTSIENQAKSNATATTLQRIQEAVLGQASARQPDGTALVRGFVADMGRVPKAILDPHNYGVLTLGELVTAGANSPWSLKQVATSTCPNCTADDLDTKILVSTGWGGPYLRLQSGATDITDGWNHQLTTGVPGVPAHLFKYVGPGQSAVSIAGDPVNGVTAYGVDDASGGTDYNQDSSVQFNPADYASVMVGSLTVITNGSTFKNTSLFQGYNPLYVRVYGPAGGDGSKIRCDIVVTNLAVDTYTATYTLGGLLQGPKVIRAKITSGTAPPVTRYSLPITVMLVPGTNKLDITVDRASP